MGGSILEWLFVGLLAGVLGRIALRGRKAGGFVLPVLVGIVGALTGGAIGMSLAGATSGMWRGDAAPAVGAVLLIALYRFVIARRVR